LAVPGERLLTLQILRFLAASGVIVLHATQVSLNQHQVGLIGSYGVFGVDLFFVLSGVIIAKIATRMSPHEFLVKRMTRILPIYWLLSLAWMGCLAAVGLLSWSPFVTSFLLVPSRTDCYLVVAWTLRFELLFYLATAVVLFRPRAGLVGVSIGYAIAFVARFWWPQNPVLELIGSPLALEFVAGVAITRVPATRATISLAAAAALVWLVAVGASGYVGESDARALIYGAPAALIVYVACNVTASGVLASRLAYLGDASYCAYLVHIAPLFLLASLMRLAPAPLAVPAAVAGCWLLAVCLHEAVEKPLLAVCRRTLAGQALWRPARQIV
jgi:exopolysaccharide production protein ExoZ